MVSGLVIFMHADSQSSAVFQPIGIIMLTTSLCCDAVLSNLSERIMNQYNVGQDQFIYKLYSIALVGIVGAATVRGDLVEGTRYLLTPGTYSEVMEGTEATWSVHGKIFAIILFSSTGFLGSSCSALITKEFGALTMSITSTARKATTLFLSFALFKDNVCTKEHIEGIILFITALIGKSIRASRHGHGKSGGSSDRQLNKKETSPLQAKYGEVGVNTPDSYHRNDGMVKRRKRLLGDIV
jgi:adenosine 3'-phospho 5'-phosphosulfate transporter B3